MPIDRSNNTNNARPLMPTLATTRTAKTPIAPRLAASAVSASSSQSSRTIRSDTSTAPRLANATARDDLQTSAKSLLSGNITPRSSSRKSRVGFSSANTTPGGTPSGTPVSSRPASTIDLPAKDQGHDLNSFVANGLGRAPASSRPRSVVGGSSNTGNAPYVRSPIGNIYAPGGSDGGAQTDSPKFFHALDVKQSQESAAPTSGLKKPATFFYANGAQETRTVPQAIPSPPLSSLGRPTTESKFFHADSIPDPKAQSPLLSPLPPKSPEPTPSLSSTISPTLRPPSPPKDSNQLSYRKGASQIIRPTLNTRPSPLSILPGHNHPPSKQSYVRDPDDERYSRRRSSAASSALRINHGKSASLSSIDSVSSLKRMPSHPNEPLCLSPSPLHNENRVVSSGSSIPDSVSSEPPPPTDSVSQLHSPAPPSPKSILGQSTSSDMNEIAANARRERKVLDLEISNSSLLAINRQLEREVRKQKAELRRYRRMTRTGGLSRNSIISVSGDFSAIGVSDMGDLSDMEEEQSIPDDTPEDSEDESSTDEGALSPTALAEKDAGYRLKDEKRLQLDLSKHRELLIDSQKMNQSIKRCLNWTEELIKDAKKALEYQVRASDVQLGGRVLNSEDPVHADEAESHTLLSPWTPSYNSANPFEHPSLSCSEKTDRDSGVDLDALKPFFPGFPSLPGLPTDISDVHSLVDETPSRPPRSPDVIGETY